MRTQYVVWRMVVALTLFESSQAFPEESCATLDSCIEHIQRHAKGQGQLYAHSMHRDDERLVDRVLGFEGAVPRLIPLLRDDDDGIANFAAIVLRDAKIIDPSYLPDIHAGLDRGLGWLPLALCAMPGDAPAREAVERFLVSKQAPANQEAFAVQRCGMRAVPFILEAAKCTKRCPPKSYLNLSYVLADSPPTVQHAVAVGLAEALREPRKDRIFSGILTMIASIGEAARGLEPQLMELRKRLPARAWQIDSTLIDIRATTAGDIFARRLRNTPSNSQVELQLADLAALGASGRSAGAEVMRFLDVANPRSRLAAARTLGYIDYQPAVPAMLNALEDPVDMRLNRIAAESLGRLHSKSAIAALRKVADHHWYPPVRHTATTALRHIVDDTEYASASSGRALRHEFLLYLTAWEDKPVCRAWPNEMNPYIDRTDILGVHDGAQLEKLRYQHDFYYGQVPGRSKIVREVPTVALRVDGGWLAGSDRGEWGGELMFLRDDGQQQLVLSDNVFDVFRFGERIVVITGLAHMGINDGEIHSLSPGPSGVWKASLWRVLPLAPQNARRVGDGLLRIEMYGGDSILLAADGTMRMAPCEPPAH